MDIAILRLVGGYYTIDSSDMIEERYASRGCCYIWPEKVQLDWDRKSQGSIRFANAE